MNQINSTKTGRTFGKNTNQANAPKGKRPYDPTDNKGRGYKFLWMVQPDYWKPSWGQVPVLGYVRADSEFHAKYAAYDKGLLICNATFGPKVTKQAPKKFAEQTEKAKQ